MAGLVRNKYSGKLLFKKLSISVGLVLTVFYFYQILLIGIGGNVMSSIYAQVANNSIQALDDRGDILVKFNPGVGCNGLLLERCASLILPSTVLSNNEVMMNIIDSAINPCQHLRLDDSGRRALKCDEKGANRWIVALNFVDSNRDVLFTLKVVNKGVD